MLIKSLHRAHQFFAALFAEHSHLTVTQFLVLDALARHRKPVSQHALCALASIDRSTLSAMLPGLIDRDLIERRRDTRDLRAYEISLTEKGKGARRRASDAIATAEQAFRRSDLARELRAV